RRRCEPWVYPARLHLAVVQLDADRLTRRRRVARDVEAGLRKLEAQMLPVAVVGRPDLEQRRFGKAREPLAVRLHEEEPSVPDRAIGAEVERVRMDQRGRLDRREVEAFDDGHGCMVPAILPVPPRPADQAGLPSTTRLMS